MYSPTCNSFQLGSRAPHRKLWVYRTLGLCCLALVVVSGGCRKDSAEWKVAAATNEQANENPEAAIELLQKALQMDPESSFIKLRLARLLAENDQGDLGLTLCDEVLEDEPRHKSVWFVRSHCLLSVGRFKESLAAYQEAVSDVVDKGPDELNQLAYLRGLAGFELDKALRQIDTGIREYQLQINAPTAQGLAGFIEALSGSTTYPMQTWGGFSNVPIEISTIVSASLLSRHTDNGHLFVMDILNAWIQEEQQVWLAKNKGLELLIEAQENLSSIAPDLESKQQANIEKTADLMERGSGKLRLLLAARSLIFEDQGQSKLADLDRLWIQQIGAQPQAIYDDLPNDDECMLLLKDSSPFLDTRGFVITQMPWQLTWTEQSGRVLQVKETRSVASYGDYDSALQALDLAIAGAEIRLLVLNSDVVNRIERSIDSIRVLKERETRIVAVLRHHRRQAHLKAQQLEAAELDQRRIEELGFEADSNLF